jgi:hypothetical protein
LRFEASPENSSRNPIWKILDTKNGWQNDSSSRTPAYQAWGPKFKPQYHKKKKKWGGEFVPQMFPRGPIVEEA